MNKTEYIRQSAISKVKNAQLYNELIIPRPLSGHVRTRTKKESTVDLKTLGLTGINSGVILRADFSEITPKEPTTASRGMTKTRPDSSTIYSHLQKETIRQTSSPKAKNSSKERRFDRLSTP